MADNKPLRRWMIHFTDGKKATYLTHDAQTKKEALAGARERFGKKVKKVE